MQSFGFFAKLGNLQAHDSNVRLILKRMFDKKASVKSRDRFVKGEPLAESDYL
jgi:hypothetical protein